MELVAVQNAAVPVPRRTPEWGWLEYLLQVSVQSTKLRLRAAWSVANKRLAVECAMRCRGLLQLHAWVPVSELPPDESMQEICQNGFRVGHTGVSFHIGNVRLPGSHGYGKEAKMGRNVRSRGRSMPQGRRLYEFLLCRVGVGRSYLIESAQQADAMDLPPEYDSFFVRHEVQGDPADEENFGVFPRHVLHHEYIVRDASQALPIYLVHFEFDPEEDEKLALPLCENCGVQAAKLYCEADDACFCPACDTKVHAVNTIARNHTRVEINRRPSRPPGRCPDHSEADADEFCLECKVPVCQYCRSLGSHSGGEAAKHKRVPLLEAYEHALKGEQHILPGMPDRQVLEQRLVGQLDAKLAQVQEAGRRAEDIIYDAVHKAVREGQQLAEEQANLYLADELEAKRQLEQAAWMESFLEEHVKALPPPDFLGTWLLHASAREEVAEGATTATRPKAGAGLRVEGGLRLLAGEAGRSNLRDGLARNLRGGGGAGRSPRSVLDG